MTEPLLRVFQAEAFGNQQACAAVSQVMKSDVRHAMFFQELAEFVADKIRRKWLAVRHLKM